MKIEESEKWYTVKISKTTNLLVPRKSFDIDKEILKHKKQIHVLKGMIKEHQKSSEVEG